MKKTTVSVFIFLLVITLFTACKKDDPPPPPVKETGKIAFTFSHKIDGQMVEFDTMKYTNEAGNPYLVGEIMYFISDVTLHNSDGSTFMIDDWKDINYIDTNIPSTLSWQVYDSIPAGSYTHISFTFGINEAKNISMMYVNPPEVNMMWPGVLGGGYHYMMINGKWKNLSNQVEIYNFHLGIGQLYKSDSINCIDSIYAFVQNYFTVDLPSSSFTLENNTTKTINLVMNVESWFKTPNIYDHNYWGGSIMQNQPAMNMIKENGFDVFTVESID